MIFSVGEKCLRIKEQLRKTGKDSLLICYQSLDLDSLCLHSNIQNIRSMTVDLDLATGLGFM